MDHQGMAVDQDAGQFEDIQHMALATVEGHNQGQGVNSLDGLEEDTYHEPVHDPGCQDLDDIQNHDGDPGNDDYGDMPGGEDEREMEDMPGSHEDEPPRMGDTAEASEPEPDV